MRCAAVVLSVSIALAMPASAEDVAGLVSEAANHVHEWSVTPQDSIGGFIEKSLAEIHDFGALTKAVAKRFSLDETSARLITVAELHNIIELDTRSTENPDEAAG